MADLCQGGGGSQSNDDRHAGTDELLQMEAEVDQFAPRDAATAQQAAIAQRLAADQVEFHAPQAQIVRSGSWWMS